MVILRNKDFYCANIHCDFPLTKYEQDRQHKSWKYRFCHTCRCRSTFKTKASIEWKCIGCGKIMSVANRIGQYYCDQTCHQKQRSKDICKAYRVNKLAKAIVNAGGLEHYKVKISI